MDDEVYDRAFFFGYDYIFIPGDGVANVAEGRVGVQLNQQAPICGIRGGSRMVCPGGLNL